MSHRRSVVLHDRHEDFLENNDSVNFSGLCRQALDICIETESILNMDSCAEAVIKTESGERIELEFTDKNGQSIEIQSVDVEPEETNYPKNTNE